MTPVVDGSEFRYDFTSTPKTLASHALRRGSSKKNADVSKKISESARKYLSQQENI